MKYSTISSLVFSCVIYLHYTETKGLSYSTVSFFGVVVSLFQQISNGSLKNCNPRLK